MLVEEALIGPLPFFQEQMSEMGLKTGKAQCEQMFSAVHPTTDIAKIFRHVRLVPTSRHRHLIDHLVSAQ